jgi:hypothetical protein
VTRSIVVYPGRGDRTQGNESPGERRSNAGPIAIRRELDRCSGCRLVMCVRYKEPRDEEENKSSQESWAGFPGRHEMHVHYCDSDTPRLLDWNSPRQNDGTRWLFHSKRHA